MHRQRDMLTVEFVDRRGGYQGSVFFLPRNEAEEALRTITPAGVDPVESHDVSNASCPPAELTANSILVKRPAFDQTDVPAAYRVLVYEHIIQHSREIPGTEVHRDGGRELLAIHDAAFHDGVQARQPGKARFDGAGGVLCQYNSDDPGPGDYGRKGHDDVRDQIHATQQGESESVNVIDNIAQQVVKKWAREQKRMQRIAS
jgi:hypothetical protein